MPNHVYQQTSATPFLSTSAGTTQYSPIGQTHLNAASSEVNSRYTTRTPGRFSLLAVRVTTNSINTGNSTVAIRKSGADTAVSVSIASSATGVFSDTTNTDTTVSTNTVNYRVTASGTTGSFSINQITCAFENTVDTTKGTSLCAGIGPDSIGANNTSHFLPVAGLGDGGNTTESLGQTAIRTATTVKNMLARVTSNTRNNTTTITARVNGTDGPVTVSIGSNTSGAFEDTTNTQSLTPGDLLTIHSKTTSGGAGGTISTYLWKVDLEGTSANADTPVVACRIDGSGLVQNQQATNYFSVSGNLSAASGNDAWRINTVTPLGSINNLSVNIGTNDLDSASTLRIYKTGASTGHTVSVTAATTGQFTSTDPAISTNNTDWFHIQTALGGSGAQTISFRSLSTVTSAVITAQALLKQIDEPSLSIAEAQQYVRKRIQQIDESVSIGEATLTSKGIVKVVDETISLAQSLFDLRNKYRALTENIPITESILNPKNLVRFGDFYPGGEGGFFDSGFLSSGFITSGVVAEELSAGRMNITETTPETRMSKVRQLADEIVSLSETVTAAMVKLRQLDEGSINITESVLNILGKTRIVDEALSLTEPTPTSIAGKVREVTENVSLTEDTPTHRKGITPIVDESISISESTDRSRDLVRSVEEPVSISTIIERVRQLARVVDESVSIAEVTTAIKSITQIIDEAISIGETTDPITAVGQVQIVNESLSILESILTRLTVSGGPVQAPLELRVGGRLRKKRRKFRILELQRTIPVGPRYYLPQRQTQTTQEPLKLLDQQKSELAPAPRSILSVSATCRYDILAPTPSVESIIKKDRGRNIITQAAMTYTLRRQKQQLQFQKEQLEKQRQQLVAAVVTEKPRQKKKRQPREQITKYRRVHSATATASYNVKQYEEVSTTLSASYRRLVSVSQTSPPAKYDIKVAITTPTLNASYNIHKPIPKDHEQKIASIQQMIKMIQHIDLVEQVVAS